MTSHYITLLGVLMMVTFSIVIPTTLQNPVAQNYSKSILRQAKVAQIRAYLKPDADPCDDFYKFACGKWKRLHPAKSASTKKTSYLQQLKSVYVQKCADMLNPDRYNTAESQHLSDSGADRQLRNFYESCRNKEALQQLGMQPIINVVDFKGGWPQINVVSWYEYEYDWLKTVAELRRKLGVDILIGLDIVPDFSDEDMHSIKVGAPKFDLGSKDAYLSDNYGDVRREYKAKIAHKLRTYFHEMPEKWANEVAQQVLDVEKQLAKGLPDNADLTLKQTTRQRYVSEMKEAYGSYVDISRYLNIIFNETIYVQVYETPEDYMSNLVEVIKQTPKLTIANYTMWRVLEKFEFAGEVNEKQNDKWCVQKIIKYFPHQLENMYYRNYHNMDIVNELQSLWAEIKEAFREELMDSKKLTWISLDTRQKAVLKLNDMKMDIMRHDDESRSFMGLANGLRFRKDKYYENLFNIMQWYTEHKLAKLIEKPQSADDDIILPTYKHALNIIQVPILFLQSRFFWDPAYPNAMKYGTLGFFLAQQMIKGFDNIGHKHDLHGYQRSWWDMASEYAFEDRSKCFAKQYQDYKHEENDISDAELLATSISDNGGLAIAHLAYTNWRENVDDLSLEEVLPLENYSPKQLFFISFGQMWCADYAGELMEHLKVVPETLRLNTALSNFNDFAREMKCQLGSKMNPEKKCIIY